MKSIVLATALVATSAFGAFAQQAPVALSSAIQSQIQTLVPGADLANLTSAQYVRLSNLFSNTDDLRPGSDPSGTIKAILGAQ